MSCPLRRSRYGWVRTSPSSSATTDACLPSARSASMRSSSAANRCSSSRAISARANGSSARSASAAPRQSSSAPLRSAAAPSGAFVLRLFDEALEAAEVDLFRRGSEKVARGARDDRVFAERLPQPRHIHLERLRRGGGRPLAPEPVDEDAVGRDDVPGAKDEHREERPAACRRPGRAARPPATLPFTEDS